MVGTLDDLSAWIRLQLSSRYSFSSPRWYLFRVLLRRRIFLLFPSSRGFHLLPYLVLLMFILSLFERDDPPDSFLCHLEYLFLLGSVFGPSNNLHFEESTE
jgi:hypothetical protein